MNLLVKVNGDSIRTEELDSAVARYIVQLEEDEDSAFEPTPDNMKYIKTEVLNQLIERRLLLQIACKKEIVVPDTTVEKSIRNMMSEYENQEAWENNLLALRTDGEHLFQEVKDDLTLEKLKKVLTAGSVDFTDKGLEDYFEEHKEQMKEPDLYSFYEITVASSEEVREAAFLLEQKKDISDLKKDFKARGMEFNHYSDIPATRLPAELLKVLSDLKEGKTGTLIAGENQLIVYRLLKKRIGKKLEFKNVKKRLKEYLMQQGQKEIMDKLIDEEMQKTRIEYIDISALEHL